MAKLTRDQILKSAPKTRAIATDEFGGGDLLIRALSTAALVEFLGVQESLQGAETYARLVQLSACDEDGRPLFSAEDIPAIEGLSFAEVKRIGLEIMDFNGMRPGQDRELVKNS